jgi:hypothetical protein
VPALQLHLIHFVGTPRRPFGHVLQNLSSYLLAFLSCQVVPQVLPELRTIFAQNVVEVLEFSWHAFAWTENEIWMVVHPGLQAPLGVSQIQGNDFPLSKKKATLLPASLLAVIPTVPLPATFFPSVTPNLMLHSLLTFPLSFYPTLAVLPRLCIKHLLRSRVVRKNTRGRDRSWLRNKLLRMQTWVVPPWLGGCLSHARMVNGMRWLLPSFWHSLLLRPTGAGTGGARRLRRWRPATQPLLQRPQIFEHQLFRKNALFIIRQNLLPERTLLWRQHFPEPTGHLEKTRVCHGGGRSGQKSHTTPKKKKHRCRKWAEKPRNRHRRLPREMLLCFNVTEFPCSGFLEVMSVKHIGDNHGNKSF